MGDVPVEGVIISQRSSKQQSEHMPRTPAETAFVQLLLDVLKIINDAISTATGPVSWSLADRGTGSRLLDAWPNMIRASLRPPPFFPIQLFPGHICRRDDPRNFRLVRLGN